MTTSLRALDLFCGAGGFSAGLAEAGFNLVGAVDSWPVASETYSRNFSHPILCKDLASMSGEELRHYFNIEAVDLDLVVGGPPCQGFSIQRIGQDEDERNNLVLEFARLVRELNPRAFVMENVLGLLGARGKPLAAAFESELVRAGYQVAMAKVNAADYGVPQLRRRVVFFGWLPDRVTSLSVAQATHTPLSYRTVQDAIGDLASPPHDYSPSPLDSLHRRMRMAPQNALRISAVPPGGGMMDLPIELRAACHRNGAERIGHRYVYGRLAGDQPAGTITGRFDSFTRGKFAHPSDDRNITLREGARLQTFPDTFEFVGTQEAIAAQIGNAVPPLLAKALAMQFARDLTGLEQPAAFACQLPLLEATEV